MVLRLQFEALHDGRFVAFLLQISWGVTDPQGKYVGNASAPFEYGIYIYIYTYYINLKHISDGL